MWREFTLGCGVEQGQKDEAAAGSVGCPVLMLGASTPVGETGPWKEGCSQEAALTTLPLSHWFGRVMFQLRVGLQAGEPV